MAKYFEVKFHYTRAINYAADMENGLGAFEEFMNEDPLDLSQSHLYSTEQRINDILVFDLHGSQSAKRLIYRTRTVI